MNKHILLAGSDVPPVGLEWQPTGKILGGEPQAEWAHLPTYSPELLYGSGGYDLCGCCGARYADTIEKFNTTFAGRNTCAWQDQANTYNRGVLAGINLPVNDVKEVPGSVVEHIQCGDDVLSLRLRMEQVYGN